MTLKERRQLAIEQRLQGIPEGKQKTYLQAVKYGRGAAAIKAQCQECCGYSKLDIRHCPDLSCPLWLKRPCRKREQKIEENSLIEKRVIKKRKKNLLNMLKSAVKQP